MEPKNNIIGKLSISWTHVSNTWATPQLRKEVREMCDHLYTKLSSQQIMDQLEQIDHQVSGEDHPDTTEMILAAYQKHNKN